jgi:hypothetical protein
MWDLMAKSWRRPTVIEANAAQFRDALSKQKYNANPTNLGVMSELTFRSLDDVETWPDNKLPSFTAAPGLGELKATVTFKAFQVRAGEFQTLENRIGTPSSVFESPASQISGDLLMATAWRRC